MFSFFTQNFIFLTFSIFIINTTATSAAATVHRHLLHQPFFPLESPPPAQPPTTTAAAATPQPQHQPATSPNPKYPFTATTAAATPQPPTAEKPFFPLFPSPPPPLATTTLATFPANISSLLFPQQPSSPYHRHVLAIAVSVSLLTAAVVASVSTVFIYSRATNRLRSIPTTTTTATEKPPRSEDSSRLFPPNTAPSDKPPPAGPPLYTSPNVSSEFLYLGTLVNSRGEIETHQPKKSNIKNSTLKNPNNNVASSVKFDVLTSSSSATCQKLGSGSPELRPLPPLPRHNYYSYTSGEAEVKIVDHPKHQVSECVETGGGVDDDDEEFFSPRGSSGRKESPKQQPLGSCSPRREFNGIIGGDNYGSRSFNSRTASYPYSDPCSPSITIPSSHQSPIENVKSPDSVVNFPAPPVMMNRSHSSVSSSSCSSLSQNSPEKNFDGSLQTKQCVVSENGGCSTGFVAGKMPPPAPPPPPPRFCEMPEVNSGPPVLVTPSRPSLTSEQLGVERKDEDTPTKPKLKPLHWDKVRASSDRVMVWDQFKSSSFQLNEEMIETLFMVNNDSSNCNLNHKDSTRRQVLPTPNQENRVLDPKKSQNIAILLRALNVTIDEVCEALLEGNSDTPGTELLESLLKMAPSKEEERKLKEFKDESPFKLGPAEKFLREVLDIPFAFKRIDAMLYIANFDSEVDYLRRSFETLQSACEELRNSRMFLKLLEAVLKTGNRMNVGTNRGDAHAFKLDTLLKLVDIKGTDGKTTLLHFVLQEIIRAEGSRLSTDGQTQMAETTQPTTFHDEVECRKRGLQVVSGLSGELTNVKKAAAMDSDVLTNEVAKLISGISKVIEVMQLNEDLSLKDSSRKFRESMNGFLKKAEEEIVKIQAQERAALSLVKEITEYFHGNSAKEEAHPFRIFMVVRDFLSFLDQACKEVGKINERTIYSSVRPLPVPSCTPPAFPIFNGKQQFGSSDDDGSSST